MRDFLEYRRSAIAEGEKGPVREYVLVPGHDPSRADALARNLATQGIEVRRAEEPIKLGDAHHSRRRLPRVERAADRRAWCATCSIRRRSSPPSSSSGRKSAADAAPDRSDLRHHRRGACRCSSTWSWSTSPAAIAAKARAVPSQSYARRRRRAPLAAGKVGYLMPWGCRGRGAHRPTRCAQGIRMHSVGGAFTLGGRRYPIGTALIRTAGNPADLHGAAGGAGREARRRGGADRLGLGR